MITPIVQVIPIQLLQIDGIQNETSVISMTQNIAHSHFNGEEERKIADETSTVPYWDVVHWINDTTDYLAHNPDDVETGIALASTLNLIGEAKKAACLFWDILEILECVDPYKDNYNLWHSAWNGRGVAYDALGLMAHYYGDYHRAENFFTLARHDFDQILKFDPNDWIATQNEQVAYIHLHQLEYSSGNYELEESVS